MSRAESTSRQRQLPMCFRAHKKLVLVFLDVLCSYIFRYLFVWFDIRFSWFPDPGRFAARSLICKSPFGRFTTCHKEGPACGRIPYDLRAHQRASSFFFMSAATYSPTFAVPSAVSVLTVVFGMGTGVSPIRIATDNVHLKVFSMTSKRLLAGVFDWSFENLPRTSLKATRVLRAERYARTGRDCESCIAA